MILVGLCGKKTSGKSTAARYLVDYRGFEHSAFAGPLKRAVRSLFGLTVEHTDGKLKEVPLPGWGDLTPRKIMQDFGSSMRETFGDDFWVKFWRRSLSGLPTVVDDVRYENEAEIIRQLGGIVVRIERPGVPDDDLHPSERLDWEPDVVIENSGTPDGLYQILDALLRLE